MSEIRKAYPGDFDLIYPLLKEFDAKGMTEERWRLLFMKHWTAEEDHVGYVLTENGVAYGFIGCVFSQRIIDGNKEKFCGLSSWIVHPDYRSESILLLNEVLRLKNYTITSFTSIPEAADILKKLRFKILDTNYLWFLSGIQIFRQNRDLKFITDTAKVRSLLTGQDQKIFDDHIHFNAQHLIMVYGKESCYFIFKKIPFYRRKLINMRVVYYANRIWKIFTGHSFLDKEIMVARIHYISNKEMFQKFLPTVTKKISREFNLKGIVIDRRFIKGETRCFGFVSMPQISLYRSATLAPEQIDSLYTELFVLDY